MKPQRLASLALLAAALAATGCAKNNASISFKDVCSIPEDKCLFNPEKCDVRYIGDLVLDVALATELDLIIQVDNQLAVGGPTLSAGSVNANDAYVEQYEVSFDVEDGPAGLSLAGFTGNTGSVARAPASGSTALEIRPIDNQARHGAAQGLAADLLDALPNPGDEATLIANVKLKGHLDTTEEWSTGDRRLPIRVCNGCLGIPVCAAGQHLQAVCGFIGQAPRSVGCVAD